MAEKLIFSSAFCSNSHFIKRFSNYFTAILFNSAFNSNSASFVISTCIAPAIRLMILKTVMLFIIFRRSADTGVPSPKKGLRRVSVFSIPAESITSFNLEFSEQCPLISMISHQFRTAPFSTRRYAGLGSSTLRITLSSFSSPETAVSFVSPQLGTSKWKK